MYGKTSMKRVAFNTIYQLTLGGMKNGESHQGK